MDFFMILFWLTASLAPFHCFFHWLPLILSNIEFSVLRIPSQEIKLILDLSVSRVVWRLQVLPNVACHLSSGVWESKTRPALWVGRMVLLFSLLNKKHEPITGVCDSICGWELAMVKI